MASRRPLVNVSGEFKELPVDDLLSGGLPTAITGFNLIWLSATGISASPGIAWVPSLSQLVRSDSTISKTGLTLSASTFYYVYVYLNSGTPDIEISTTVPAFYFNKSSTKNGDTSRRFVGSFLTDASSNIYEFVAQSTVDEFSLYWPLINATAPFRVLANGAQTAPAVVSLAGPVPDVVYKAFYCRLILTAGDTSVGVGPVLQAIAPEITAELGVRHNGTTDTYFPTATISLIARETIYAINQVSGGGTLYIDVKGFSAWR